MSDESLERRVSEHLNRIYPELVAADRDTLARRLLDVMGPAVADERVAARGDEPVDGADEAVLITYADTFLAETGPHLAALAAFWDDAFDGVFSTVHVLPFFPSSSDGGFSITDYRAVARESGEWSDIEAMARRARLMVDLVCNHGSAESEWFRNFIADQEPGNTYYLTADPQDDLDTVTRPRTHPLLLQVETAAGTRHVWTTFSHDQIDFDYRNPEVLVEFCAILGLYLAHGASRIRLDAVAYLWKQVGTTSIHLPQTHEIVKLMRTLVEAQDPHAFIITETNVPHAENVSYFGDTDEAHVVYNFTLAPLIIWSLLVERSDVLSAWLADLESPPAGATFLNFLASHDGIGLRPLEGIVDAGSLGPLLARAEAVGGGVSTYTTPSGPRPYELNASLADLLAGADGSEADRYILAHALMLSIQGIPAIYVHSMLASPGDVDTVANTGQRRDINRARLTVAQAQQQIGSGWRADVFSTLCELVRVRRSHPSFAPEQPQAVVDLGPGVIAVQRGEGDAAILAIHNVTATAASVPVPARSGRRDLLTGTEHGDVLDVAPWQAMWLVAAE